MTSDICQRLIDEVWRSYADDLDEVPEAGGIYAIGDEKGKFLYMGHSKNMKRRLHEHKSGQQEIDKFVKEEFDKNGGVKLRIKWVEEKDHKCEEGEYLQCLEEKLGYWPEFNKKRGNTC